MRIMELINTLKEYCELAKEESELPRKLVYTRYAIDILYNMWRYQKEPLIYLLFHSLVPSYNIVIEIVRRKSMTYEEILPYVNRLVEALTKAIEIIEKLSSNKSKALEEVFKLVEETILPLELDLITLRNIASIISPS